MGKQTPVKKTGKEKVQKALEIFSWFAVAIALLFAIYIGISGKGLGDGSYGPGAYYYTDVPNWENIFLHSPYLGFDHPALSIIVFALWGMLMYKLIVYLNKKIP